MQKHTHPFRPKLRHVTAYLRTYHALHQGCDSLHRNLLPSQMDPTCVYGADPTADFDAEIRNSLSKASRLMAQKALQSRSSSSASSRTTVPTSSTDSASSLGTNPPVDARVVLTSEPPKPVSPPPPALKPPPCVASVMESAFTRNFKVFLILSGCFNRYERLPSFMRYILAMLVFVPFMSFIGAVAVELIFQASNSALIASNAVACVGGIFGHMLCGKSWKRIVVWGLIMGAVFLSVPPPSVDELAKLPQTVRYSAFEEECVKRNITSFHAPLRLAQLTRCVGHEDLPECKLVKQMAADDSSIFEDILTRLLQDRRDLYGGENLVSFVDNKAHIGGYNVFSLVNRTVVEYAKGIFPKFAKVDDLSSADPRIRKVINDMPESHKVYMIHADLADKATRKAGELIEHMKWVSGWNRLLVRVSSYSNLASLYFDAARIDVKSPFFPMISVASDWGSEFFDFVANALYSPEATVQVIPREICALAPCAHRMPDRIVINDHVVYAKPMKLYRLFNASMLPPKKGLITAFNRSTQMLEDTSSFNGAIIDEAASVPHIPTNTTRNPPVNRASPIMNFVEFAVTYGSMMYFYRVSSRATFTVSWLR